MVKHPASIAADRPRLTVLLAVIRNKYPMLFYNPLMKIMSENDMVATPALAHWVFLGELFRPDELFWPDLFLELSTESLTVSSPTARTKPSSPPASPISVISAPIESGRTAKDLGATKPTVLVAILIDPCVAPDGTARLGSELAPLTPASCQPRARRARCPQEPQGRASLPDRDDPAAADVPQQAAGGPLPRAPPRALPRRGTVPGGRGRCVADGCRRPSWDAPPTRSREASPRPWAAPE